jgi:hypothetical protein
MNLTARSIKVSLVLAPAQFAHLVVPVGAGRQPFRIKIEDGRVLSGELNPKSCARWLQRSPSMVLMALQ